MTCKDCWNYGLCATAEEGTTAYYGKECAVGNVEVHCKSFSTEETPFCREDLREAIMRLSMCSLRMCNICKYKGKRRSPKKCEKVIKECQDLLAAFCL